MASDLLVVDPVNHNLIVMRTDKKSKILNNENEKNNNTRLFFKYVFLSMSITSCLYIVQCFFVFWISLNVFAIKFWAVKKWES